MNWLTTVLQGAMRPLKWWIVIAPWELGVRVRGGKTAALLKPGIRLRVPYLDRIFIQSVRLRTIIDTNINTTSRDGKCVTLSLAISFAVVDVLALYNAASTPMQTLKSDAAAALVHLVSCRKAQDLDASSIGLEVFKRLFETAEQFGLGEFDVKLTGISVSRVFRVLNNDYSSDAALGSLDHNDPAERR